MTWAQLGRHRKPILIVNIEGFRLRSAPSEHMEKLEFICAGLSVNFLVAERVEELLPMCSRHARRFAGGKGNGPGRAERM